MFYRSLLLVSCLFLIVQCTSKRVYQPISYELPYSFSSDLIQQVAADSVPWKYQRAASDFASKGDYTLALAMWDSAFPVRPQNYSKGKIDSLRASYSLLPAQKTIIEQATLHKVVIINEAHHSSLHRVFTASLLQGLYDQGYRHLGLEALGTGEYEDGLLNQRGYPVQKSGYYTKDPQFGNMIRLALNIGFHVFGYESTTDANGKQREIEQAERIQQEMKTYPNDKFLIHVGFDHAMEGTHRSWEKAMAERLHEFTGINPLTVNQVIYSEKGDTARNHPTLKAFNPTETSVLLNQENQLFRYERGEGFTDIAVFHPNTTYVKDRPNWIFTNGTKPVKLNLSDLSITFPVMVLAFNSTELINEAIPLDIIELENRDDVGYLALSNGTYTIVTINKNNQARQFSLDVD